MASEAADQLREMAINRSTHVFVQAGVGSLAGAVTTGLVETLMLDPEYAELKELIGLDKTSSVLCFSTEGGTDPDQYRRIVWEGEYPTCQQIDLSGRRSK